MAKNLDDLKTTVHFDFGWLRDDGYIVSATAGGIGEKVLIRPERYWRADVSERTGFDLELWCAACNHDRRHAEKMLGFPPRKLPIPDPPPPPSF